MAINADHCHQSTTQGRCNIPHVPRSIVQHRRIFYSYVSDPDPVATPLKIRFCFPSRWHRIAATHRTQWPVSQTSIQNSLHIIHSTFILAKQPSSGSTPSSNALSRLSQVLSQRFFCPSWLAGMVVFERASLLFLKVSLHMLL